MKSRGEALRDYIVRRLLLMIPTFLGITFFTFLLCQFVPGGQIDQLRMALAGAGGGGEARAAAAAPGSSSTSPRSNWRSCGSSTASTSRSWWRTATWLLG